MIPGRSLLRRLPWAALSFLSVVRIGVARAQEAGTASPTRQQCVDADTKAQELRRADKLMDARTALKTCIDPACPGLVRDDCAQRVDELDRVQPSLVFDVKDGQGRDLLDVKISMDGQPIADRITGAAIPVDPGLHSFKLEPRGEKPVLLRLVLHEGEQARHQGVRIGVPPPPPPSSRGSAMRTGGVVMGAFGIIGLGVGGVFAGLAASKWSAAQADCSRSSSCTPADNQAANGQRNNALTLATVSTVGFVAGSVLTAGGIVLFVLAPSRSSSEKPRAEGAVVPVLGPDGAKVLFTGWF